MAAAILDNLIRILPCMVSMYVSMRSYTVGLGRRNLITRTLTVQGKTIVWLVKLEN